MIEIQLFTRNGIVRRAVNIFSTTNTLDIIWMITWGFGMEFFILGMKKRTLLELPQLGISSTRRDGSILFERGQFLLTRILRFERNFLLDRKYGLPFGLFLIVLKLGLPKLISGNTSVLFSLKMFRIKWSCVISMEHLRLLRIMALLLMYRTTPLDS